MKIIQFEVIGLFDLYNHTLDFRPLTKDSNEEMASVFMIYGRNGIGKTTVLRMIDGLMTLDFNIFRKTKFKSAHLTFSTGFKISVDRILTDKLNHMLVNYRSFTVRLKSDDKGAVTTMKQ